MAADPSAKLVTLLTTLRKQYPGAQSGLFADPSTLPHAPANAPQAVTASAASHHQSNTLNVTDSGEAAISATGTLSAARVGPAVASPPRVHGVSAYLDHAEPILCEFVRAFLVWESTTAKAAAVIKRLDQSLVDFNELRICMTDELLRLMGRGVPRVEERAQRLRVALNGVYAREHAVTLEHLATLSKREAREYLESLDGVPRFVSARVMLVCFSAHTAPVDSRILRRLIEAQAAEANASPDEVAGQLERRVRAGEMPETYALLQAWADDLTSKEETKATGGSGRGEPKNAAKTRPAAGGGGGGSGSGARASSAKAARDSASAKSSKVEPSRQVAGKSKADAKPNDSKPTRGKKPEPKTASKPPTNNRPSGKRKS